MTPRPRGLTPAAARGMVKAVLGRPDLWWTALGSLRRMAAPGWLWKSPHLPLPDSRLWDFRMVTAYGRADVDPRAADVISYLEWCRSTRGNHRIGWDSHGARTGRLDRMPSG